MLEVCWKIAPLYKRYRLWLGAVSVLVTLIKTGDLVVPFLAGKVFEAVGTHDSVQNTAFWLATAVGVWIVHGNILPWLYNRVEARRIDLFARRDVSLWSFSRLRKASGQDTAMLQTIVERGEAVIPDFAASLVKVVLPSIIPCLAVMVTLCAISPMLFMTLATGCGLYGAVTLYMNGLLMPQYDALQATDNKREQLRIRIFRALAKPIDPMDDMIEAYDRRYTEVATLGSQVRSCYLNFDLSRGVIINVMNACTWMIGIHAVRSNEFGLAVFIAFVSWSTACISYVQVATTLHKQWLETGPALRNYFATVQTLPRRAVEQDRAMAPLQAAEYGQLTIEDTVILPVTAKS